MQCQFACMGFGLLGCLYLADEMQCHGRQSDFEQDWHRN
jgi:hypothetical protein